MILYSYVYFFAGIAIALPDQECVICHPVLLCATCDLPAKALIMNMVQFNGFYGCSRCLQPGIATIYLNHCACGTPKTPRNWTP